MAIHESRIMIRAVVDREPVYKHIRAIAETEYLGIELRAVEALIVEALRARGFFVPERTQKRTSNVEQEAA